MREIMDIRKFGKTKSQCVTIPNAEIWENRPFNQWHRTSLEHCNKKKKCIDARCPFDHHPFGEYDSCDPWSLNVLSRLKRNKKVLVYFELGARRQVAFFKMDRCKKDGATIRLFSKEISRDYYFFIKSNDSYRKYGVMIEWKTVKYLAIVDSEESPFGISGRYKDFVRELVRLSNQSEVDVKKALKKLTQINVAPERLRLKNPGIFLDDLYGRFKSGKNIIPDINSALRNPVGCECLAFLILFITEMGELVKFRNALEGWLPNNRPRLKRSLDKASQWYLSQAPRKTVLVGTWRKKWREAFELPK